MGSHDKYAKYEKYIKKVKLFEGLDTSDVSDILHCGKVIAFGEGKTVFHEGMLGSNLFIVLHGQIALHKKNQFFAKCRVGDVFGEMDVLNHQPRAVTASALTDVRLFTLSEAELNDKLHKTVVVKLMLNIIHILSERLEESNSWVTKLRAEKSAIG
jgi:CRP/FNR family transcriptional regulator, cyclic AMP receptor protein